MKKYIKSARQSYRRTQAQGMPAQVAAIRKDIRTVARCENQAELDACDIQSYNPKYIKHVWESLAEKKGIVDFDEKIDLILEWLQSNLVYFKEQADNYTKEVETADAVTSKIENYLDSTNLYYDTQDDGIHVSPDDRSRDALIAFIDDMLADLGGKYFGTGRGGSWTSWNVKIDGIEFQIGPSDDGTCWLIREV